MNQLTDDLELIAENEQLRSRLKAKNRFMTLIVIVYLTLLAVNYFFSYKAGYNRGKKSGIEWVIQELKK